MANVKAQANPARALKILAGSSWVVLLLCVAAFFYLAVAIPNVISESVIKDCDENVRQVRAATDLHEVQQIAAWRTQGEAYVMAAARGLLILSVATFLICGGCAAVSLWQLRRLRRDLHETQKADS